MLENAKRNMCVSKKLYTEMESFFVHVCIRFGFTGFGFADLENGVRCSPATVMRIASISKSLTMTAVARLWEDEKLDLDSPIQKYIPNFPTKTYNGEEVSL